MTLTRRFGFGAAALGLAAAFAGSPYRHARGRLDIGRTIRAIDSGTDHVTALQLAAWIRARKPGLRVIDLQTSEAFATYAIPTAANMSLDTLMNTEFDPHDTIVLYSGGGAHAGQAWVLLQALGVANVTFIAGGLADWHDEVMAPVIRPGTDQMQQFTLSRYFGGTPRPAGDGDYEATPAIHMPQRRRGC